MSPRALFEYYADYLVAITAVLIHLLSWPKAFPSDHSTELFANVINIAGVAIGFLATGQSLLCSLTNNFVAETLRKHGRLSHMLRFFTRAIVWCLALVLASLCSYWLDFSKTHWLFSVWLGLFAGAATSTIRIVQLFTKVVHGSD